VTDRQTDGQTDRLYDSNRQYVAQPKTHMKVDRDACFEVKTRR